MAGFPGHGVLGDRAEVNYFSSFLSPFPSPLPSRVCNSTITPLANGSRAPARSSASGSGGLDLGAIDRQMSTRASAILFMVGIVFLVFGLFLYLTWWFFLYGMIAVTIGAILVLISKKPWLLKLLVAGIPALFVTWSFSGSFAPAQTFLIPPDFSGKFIVVYGEPCGTPDHKVNGRLEVHVPAHGCAILQREGKGGWVDDEFYFEDATGNRTRIAESTGLPIDSIPRPSVTLMGSGSQAAMLPSGGSSTEAPGAIHFTWYFVHTTGSSTHTDESPLDTLMESMVQTCRRGEK